MPAPKPTPDPLTAEDCRAITRWLLKLRSGRLTRTQRTELEGLTARFERHSYIHRENQRQTALMSADPSL